MADSRPSTNLFPLFGLNNKKRKQPESDNHQSKDSKRSFRPQWLKDFDFLRFDTDTSKLTCVYCTSNPGIAGNTAFVSGEFDQFKRETIVKHTKSGKHQKCRDLYISGNDKNASVVRAFESQVRKEGAAQAKDLQIKVNTAYMVAKEELPFTKYKPILYLQMKNGLDVSYKYANDQKCAEFIATSADILKSKTLTSLNQSNYMSIMFDGATDVSVKETEAILVRFMRDGQAVTELLSLAELEHANASGILDAIKQGFENAGLAYDEKLIGFCADGAAVNHGHRNGVKVLLTEKCPWLLSIWCMPHRLELAISSVLKSSTYFSKIMRVLNLLYKTYHYSCKSRRELQKLGEQLGMESAHCPKRAYGTRWSPHLSKALKVLTERPSDGGNSQYCLLQSHMEHLGATHPLADIQGRGKFVAGLLREFDFATYVFFMTDVFKQISLLSLTLQSDKIILPTAITALQTCIVQIESLKTKPGPNLRSFLTDASSLMSDDKDEINFEGTHLKGLPAEFTTELETLPSALLTSMKKDLTDIIDGFKKMFAVLLNTKTKEGQVVPGDAKAVQCLSTIFHHDAWPKDLSCYGDDEIQYLIDWFKPVLSRGNCSLDQIQDQWVSFKITVRNSFFDKNFAEMTQLFLTKSPYKETFKDLIHLMEILLVLPLTSSSCERVFSCQKRVKSDTRSSLHVRTVEDLIRISSYGPEMEDFDPQPIIDEWVKSSIRPRRPQYKAWPALI